MELMNKVFYTILYGVMMEFKLAMCPCMGIMLHQKRPCQNYSVNYQTQ